MTVGFNAENADGIGTGIVLIFVGEFAVIGRAVVKILTRRGRNIT